MRLICLMIIAALGSAYNTFKCCPKSKFQLMSDKADNDPFFEDGSSKSLWKEQVEYVDLSSLPITFSPTSTEIPLFVLGGAFYPSGNTFLNVFEMRYRTMMFDIAKKDDTFGYIHSDGGGQIAQVGTLCKVIDRQLLEDGRQYIALEGVNRFRVRKILRTLPYLVAEVEPNLDDAEPKDQEAAIKIELETYSALKFYMRLMKSYEPNKNMVVSKATKATRPLIHGNLSDEKRRTNFSFALANMIQMTQARESQLLLQTTDVIKRLSAEKVILMQAAELIAEQLIKIGVITAEIRDELQTKSFRDDFDNDILPDDMVVEESQSDKDEWDISNIE